MLNMLKYEDSQLLFTQVIKVLKSPAEQNTTKQYRCFEKLVPDPKLMTDTQHSTLRIHTPHSGRIPYSNTCH